MRDRDDFNMVTVSGRLPRDPELRRTPEGAAVLDFYLACNRYLKKQTDEGPTYEQLTVFVKVTAWNHRAENLVERLNKGDEVLVTGQLVDDNFKRDGEKTSGRLKVDNLLVVKVLKKAE